jgi:hypothetical protein
MSVHDRDKTVKYCGGSRITTSDRQVPFPS